MRRPVEGLIAVLGAAAVSAATLWPALGRLGEALPGGWAAWGQGWGMARTRWALTGVEAPPVDGPVVLAGKLQLLTGALLSGAVSLPAAVTLTTWAWLAAGVLALYGVARAVGAGPVAAAAAAAVGGLNPAVLQAVHSGWLEWLGVPLVALALWGAASPEAGWRAPVVGGVAAGLAALCTPVFGVVTLMMAGWASLGAGGRRTAAVVGLGAAVAAPALWPWRHGAAMPRPMVEGLVAYVDPVDLAAPLWTWRAWGVHAGLAGLAALAGGLWLMRRHRGWVAALGGAAALGVVLALGPEVAWGGIKLRLGGGAVPLPARLLQLPLPPGTVLNWKIAMVPAMAAAGLLVARLPRRPAAGVLALALVEALALSGTCPTVDGRVPVAIAQLAEGEGTVLHLPIETGPESEGLNLRALYFQAVHRRPLLTGMGPTWRSRLLADPLVVLAANAQAEEPRWAVPPAGPVSVLRDLGVTALVLDRAPLGPGPLAVLDRLLTKACESPQRDLAGRVDLFHIPPGEPTGFPIEALPLAPVDQRPDRWLTPAEYLARWR
ncbi:MAG: hypothetical protein H6739_35575 [Alphaproteobacteria bacterium]|nr:hypothetical protein [Alphaproteobacteria bacterium]